MPQITLFDLASELNISVSTVSKALKGYPDVSEKTKKSVIQLAHKLNFSPNAIASNLRTQSTKTIGVIVPKIVNRFFSKVIEGILNTAEDKGYMVIILQSNDNYEQEKKQIDHLIRQGVDGVLISLTGETENTEHIQRLQTRGIPLIMYDRVSKNIDCSQVVIDDQNASYEAVSYLLSLGHKRIAYITSPLIAQNFNNRFLGYKQALKENGIPFDKTLIYICNEDEEFDEGYSQAENIIQDHSINGVDIVFCITDIIAIGAMKYFEDHNINIPKDVGVIGFSNTFSSAIITPAMTTVNQPDYKMGVKSVELLLEEIALKKEKKPIISKKIILPTSLVIREST